MSEWVTLQASDGTELQAYVARPKAEIKAMLVVVQEILASTSTFSRLPMTGRTMGFFALRRRCSTASRRASICRMTRRAGEGHELSAEDRHG